MNGGDPGGFQKLALGGAILVGVGVLGYQAVTNPQMMADSGPDPGAGFMPVLLLGLLALAGLYFVLEGMLRLARADCRIGISDSGSQSLVFPALMIVSLIAYVGLVDIIGFFVVSLVLTVFWAVVLVVQDYGIRQVRPLLVGVVGAVLLTAAIFAVFRELIGVPLD